MKIIFALLLGFLFMSCENVYISNIDLGSMDGETTLLNPETDIMLPDLSNLLTGVDFDLTNAGYDSGTLANPAQTRRLAYH